MKRTSGKTRLRHYKFIEGAVCPRCHKGRLEKVTPDGLIRCKTCNTDSTTNSK